MDRWHGNSKHAVWFLDQDASIISWFKQINIQYWFQSAYSFNQSTCSYGVFHALKRAPNGQAYFTFYLFQEVIHNRTVTYGISDDRYIVQKVFPIY